MAADDRDQNQDGARREPVPFELLEQINPVPDIASLTIRPISILDEITTRWLTLAGEQAVHVPGSSLQLAGNCGRCDQFVTTNSASLHFVPTHQAADLRLRGEKVARGGGLEPPTSCSRGRRSAN